MADGFAQIFPSAKPPGSHHHFPNTQLWKQEACKANDPELAMPSPYSGFGCVPSRNAQQHEFRLYVVLQEGCAAPRQALKRFGPTALRAGGQAGRGRRQPTLRRTER
ncbi:uncharacterized protein B0T23DRAFT_402700 [Neurospora hispaniola]|uniref:Uncharacterized protein n=1 Tax=Neurospora hispaniola TaxID=588809 RepID=A0AAJ0MU26_9PEZI|nr:hypothetical protein B0T23DRAFT_402700 [Neurospora hispaniola]